MQRTTGSRGCSQRRQVHDGMHPAWRQFETADGVPYFHNAMLGKSTWEKPLALFSRQVRDVAYSWP